VPSVDVQGFEAQDWVRSILFVEDQCQVQLPHTRTYAFVDSQDNTLAAVHWEGRCPLAES